MQNIGIHSARTEHTPYYVPIFELQPSGRWIKRDDRDIKAAEFEHLQKLEFEARGGSHRHQAYQMGF